MFSGAARHELIQRTQSIAEANLFITPQLTVERVCEVRACKRFCRHQGLLRLGISDGASRPSRRPSSASPPRGALGFEPNQLPSSTAISRRFARPACLSQTTVRWQGLWGINAQMPCEVRFARDQLIASRQHPWIGITRECDDELFVATRGPLTIRTFMHA
jgi:hypothetical protein